jgi:hypothetical protein
VAGSGRAGLGFGCYRLGLPGMAGLDLDATVWDCQVWLDWIWMLQSGTARYSCGWTWLPQTGTSRYSLDGIWRAQIDALIASCHRPRLPSIYM